MVISKNDDGVILSHEEYQENISDNKTLDDVIAGIEKNTGQRPQDIAADRGFDMPLNKQKRKKKKLCVKRLAIPKKGKTPHPESRKSWFKRALKQRTKIEPIIGHLKCDHRMNRCRYKGKQGDTANVVWAILAWNTKKINGIHKRRLSKKAA